MNHEEILAREPKLLKQEDRNCYFERGYLGVSGLVSQEWLDRLNEVTDEFVLASREVNGKDGRFDLEPDHSSSVPRIRRLNAPVELHDLYWKFAKSGPFADISEDLLGPDFKFHHSKLNFKWADGGEEVKWHQDIQFWPHTNYDVLTLGVYLSDVTDAMAPWEYCQQVTRARFLISTTKPANGRVIFVKWIFRASTSTALITSRVLPVL